MKLWKKFTDANFRRLRNAVKSFIVLYLVAWFVVGPIVFDIRSQKSLDRETAEKTGEVKKLEKKISRLKKKLEKI